MDRGEKSREYYWKQACPVFVDAVGYTSRIEADTRETRLRLSDHFKSLKALIAQNRGRLIDTAGDGIFAEFETVKQALACLTTFLENVTLSNREQPVKRRMRFRCGVANGKVLQEEHIISGLTVNIAARLQQLAEPGTINLDGDAYREVRGDNSLSFIDQGFRILKGITNPIRVWRVSDETHSDLIASERLAQLYLDDAWEVGENDKRSSDWIGSARALAVLPFDMPRQNQDDAEGEERYLALGLAVDISNSLSRSRWLKVISPRSSFNYSDAEYQDNEIARELGVRYLLKGRMTKLDNKFNISASLIDCPTGAVIWSQKYERNSDSVLETLDQIAEQISSTIEPEYLKQEAQRAAGAQPRNMSAWDLTMRGRWHFWRGSKRNLERSISCAEQALQLQPDNSRALALLSFCYMTLVWTARVDEVDVHIRKGLDFAQRSVSADEGDANAHFTLGSALSQTGNLRRSIAAERRALELRPNFGSALGELGRMLVFDGQIEEGRLAALKAIDLSPSDPHISLFVRSLAFASFLEDDLDGATELAEEALAKRPDWFFNQITLASFEGLRGNIDAACLALEESRRLVPHYPIDALIAGHPFTDKKALERFLEGLRLAGWNEEG